MELLEDPISLIKGYARPGVRHRDGELAVAAPAAMLTSPASVNLMALPTRLSSTCLRRCSSPRPTGSDTLWYSALALTQGNLDVDREEEIAIIRRAYAMQILAWVRAGDARLEAAFLPFRARIFSSRGLGQSPSSTEVWFDLLD